MGLGVVGVSALGAAELIRQQNQNIIAKLEVTPLHNDLMDENRRCEFIAGVIASGVVVSIDCWSRYTSTPHLGYVPKRHHWIAAALDDGVRLAVIVERVKVGWIVRRRAKFVRTRIVIILNGYATAAFGKSHETPVWELSASGPTDRWPTRSGFDKFYGFIGGETDQWSPTVWDGMTKIHVEEKPGYHFMTDMTNQAVEWVQSEKSLTPQKPFFIYFAPGATHAPHHVSKEWIAKYKGQFDQGWDKLREQTLERQKRLGVVPADTKLAPKPELQCLLLTQSGHRGLRAHRGRACRVPTLT